VEHEQELRDLTVSAARELGLTIEKVHAEQFMRYLTHLIEWNKSINLTTITNPKEIIIKHFIDFPGIPLKIARPDIRLILVEPVRKKCSFLNSVIGLLKLHDVAVFNGTIEQYAKQPLRHTIDMVVLRALKYKEIKEYIPELLTTKGKIVLYRTEIIEEQEIGKEFHLVSETAFILPQSSGKRVISVLEKNSP
jgi:16S rRNA (guanine527-N7)-methyltransferase